MHIKINDTVVWNDPRRPNLREAYTVVCIWDNNATIANDFSEADVPLSELSRVEAVDDPVIGYFDPRPEMGLFVLCEECLKTVLYHGMNDPVRIYRSNVTPYKQTCHNCGDVLVEAKSEGWCELFSRPKPIECANCGSTDTYGTPESYGCKKCDERDPPDEYGETYVTKPCEECGSYGYHETSCGNHQKWVL